MLTSDQKHTFFSKGDLFLPQFIADIASGFEDFVWDRLHQIHRIHWDDPQIWNAPGAWGDIQNFKEAEMFTKNQMKKMVFTEEDIQKKLIRKYRPESSQKTRPPMFLKHWKSKPPICLIFNLISV